MNTLDATQSLIVLFGITTLVAILTVKDRRSSGVRISNDQENKWRWKRMRRHATERPNPRPLDNFSRKIAEKREEMRRKKAMAQEAKNAWMRSPRILGLMKLNEAYRSKLKPVQRRLERDLCFTSRKKYESFDAEYYLATSIIANDDLSKEIWHELKTREDNDIAWRQYCEGTWELPLVDHPYPAAMEIEQRKFVELTAKPPVSDLSLTFFYSYDSPQGKTHLERCWTLEREKIEEVAKSALVLKATGNWKKQHAKRERGAMTEKLRMGVLRRDGYRCRICGASASDGARLEVDHIVPVSKGGKTEERNLQTLCDRCNRGKGADYM